MSDQEIRARVVEMLSAEGYEVFQSDSEAHPHLVGVRADRPVVALDVSDQEGAVIALNHKIQRVRDSAPELKRLRMSRHVVATSKTSPDTLSVGDAASTRWLPVSGNAPPHDAINALRHILTPRVPIEIPQRASLQDQGADERELERIILDEAQQDVALVDVGEVMVVSGPPGSGKTLVLAARAKFLAALHPDWAIQLLCYNKALVPYLRRLVGDLENVRVETFGRFSHRHGYRVSLSDPVAAAMDVARSLKSVNPSIDVLLVDEWQDFMPAWTELALAMVRPDRGGTMLVGDPGQGLYRDSALEAELGDRHVETRRLRQPYRSTKQILQVTNALDEMNQVAEWDRAMPGRPVDLVWAECVADQSDAVVRDVQLLLEDGRPPGQIGILVSRKWTIGPVIGKLLARGVPARALYSNKGEDFDLNDPSVKVMTVHSAKGYEFEAVILMGLEHLPEPDGTSETRQQGRVGFVGSTRAKDQLILTYSKDNAYLRRIRALPETVLQRWVWPDDYGV